MNDAHWHLMLNHFPIIGNIFSLLVVAAGLILKDTGIKRAGLGMFVLTGLLTIPAYFTGEYAEHIVEDLNRGVGKFIHNHEEWAEKALITCLLSGGLAAIVLWAEITKRSFARFLILVLIAVSLVNVVLLKYTGTSGGEISHPEIRTTQFQGEAPQGGENNTGTEQSNEDNDNDND